MNKLPWIMLSALIMLPLAAHAEIYKWKDKNGVVRYSDTPPPSNVQQLPVTGKKIPKTVPTAAEAPPPATPPAPGVQGAKKPAGGVGEDVVKRENEAIQRQEKAEEDKKKVEQAEAKLKQKQQNCENAKKNYASYKIGGRMSKVGESGEREYLSDADIAAGLQQAQKDVEENCN